MPPSLHSASLHRCAAALAALGLLLAAGASPAPAADGPAADWVRPPPGLDRIEYLILTGRSLVPAWKPLADWKCRTGIPTAVVAVEDVLANPLYRGADPAETVRNLLRDLHRKWGLEWVLLGGDVNVVPTRFVKIIERQACDIYFACLEGDWNEDGDSAIGGALDRVPQAADVFLGRVPAETPAEVHAFLDKYFRYLKPSRRDWQKRALLVGAVLGDDFHWDADDHYEFLRKAYFEPAGFQVVHLEQTLFLRGRFEADPATGKCSGYVFGESNRREGPSVLERMVAEVNRGFGIVSHYDHSNVYLLGLSKEGVRPSDVKRFTNAEAPSVFLSSGCQTNQFDMESVSEELLLHPGGGAVAFIGCTTNSFAYENLYERDFFDALFRLGEYRIGRLFEASRARRCDSDFAGENPITVLNRGLALLGDPEMPVWSETPRDLSASFAAPAPGADAFEVAVAGPDGSPASGARIALWKEGEFLSAALADANGKARLPVPRGATGTAALTVTARHFLPLEREVVLAAGDRRLVPFDVDLRAGGDGALGPGETAELTVALRNDGKAPVEGAVCEIASADPLVKVASASAAVPRLEPGAVAPLDRPLSFTVSAEAPAHHVAAVTLRISMGGTALWEGPLRWPVRAPRLLLAGHWILRGGNPGLPPFEPGDAGARVALRVELVNTGSGRASNVVARLSCPSGDVRVKTQPPALPALDPGQRKACPEPFELEVDSGFSGGPVELLLTVSAEGCPPREEMFAVTEPPPVPKALRAEPGQASVRLAWDPVESPRFAGYAVEQAPSGEGPFEAVNLLPIPHACFEDAGLSSRRTCWYRVRAVDRDLNASGPSAAVAVTATFPLLRDWPKKTRSAVVDVNVADADGDGDLEIAAGDEKGGVWIWHHTGEELRHGGDNWTFGLFKELPEGAFTPSFADLDGDGRMEVLTAGRSGDKRVYAFGLDGQALPGWPKSVKERPMTAPQAADLDRDGRPEIVFREGYGTTLRVWRRDGSAFRWVQEKGKAVPKEDFAELDSFNYFLMAFADLDGDGGLDLLGIGGRGSVAALRPDGTMHAGFPFKTGEVLGSSTVAGDVDGDGRPEIVFVSDGGTQLWVLKGDGKALKGFPARVWDGKPVEGQSLPALADLDGRKGLEVLLGGRGGELFAFDGEGKKLPGFPVKLPAEATGSVAGDLDGDGAPEIACACMDGNVYAVRRDGSPVPGFPLRTRGPLRGTPAIADVDGDGDVDLVVGSGDGYVYVWDLGGQADPGLLAWPCYGGDPARTGAAPDPPPPPADLSVRGTDKAHLAWYPPKKAKPAGYHVWRSDGGLLRRLTRVPIPTAVWTDAGIVPGKKYVYAVTSVDARNRESALSGKFEWGEEAVRALFEKAGLHEQRKQFAEAIRAYEEILKTFPASAQAGPARERLERLKADTGVQESLEARNREAWVRGMFALARTWGREGKPQKARECLQKVIEKFPDSAWAEQARAELEKLKGK